MSVAAVLKEVERASRALLTEPPRPHLGASQIGGRCARQAWYGFRWAYHTDHIGRMRRLFNRGHEEEDRLIRWLRAADYEVQDYTERLMYHSGSDSYVTIPWDEEEAYDQTWAECDDVSRDRWHIERAKKRDETLPKEERLVKQWGFVDHEGHFAGSSDGKIRGPHLPPGLGGVEYKTHNDKSFKLFVQKGVLSAKPVHWVQMQVYMHYLGLKWCLYLAVNKNDDEIHGEIVQYRPEVAERYVEVALNIIRTRQAPQRLTEDPSWFECKFCDFRNICHYDETPMKNCRSCQFAEPIGNKGWICHKYHMLIPQEFIPKGCNDWDPIK